MWEIWVQSLGWEDPLEEGIATHSSYSCLENPMDRGAWRTTVHGVAKSLTQLSNFHFTLGATQALAPPESIDEVTDKRIDCLDLGRG